jgi:transcriptional regulator with XRE-family HTH domain
VSSPASGAWALATSRRTGARITAASEREPAARDRTAEWGVGPVGGETAGPDSWDRSYICYITFMTSAASLIRQARTDAAMTQAELASRAGLSQPAIARLERGDSNPTIATLANVVAATGHRLILAATPHRASFDERQLRERLAMTPAERLATFTASSRNLGTMVRRARRVND